jgi:GT2 family glycosyltransferase
MQTPTEARIGSNPAELRQHCPSEGNKLPSIAVIIVNYNGQRQLTACIEELLNASFHQEQIVVVDNGSTDNSIDIVRSAYPEIQLIALKKNVGFGPANNSAIEATDSDYVLLVNNDTLVTRDFVSGLVACMNTDSSVAAVQSLALTFHSPHRIDSFGSYFTPTGFLDHNEFGKLFNPNSKPMSCREVFSAKAACIMLRRRALQDVGLFDHDFFLYFEETDLCWRMWLRGFRVRACGSSIVFHKGGATSRKLQSELIIYQSFKNRITSLLKNLELKSIILVLPIHLFICVIIALRYLSLGNSRNALAIFGAMFSNLKDLQKTIRKRLAVQAGRRISDRELFRLVSRGIGLESMISFGRMFFRTWE